MSQMNHQCFEEKARKKTVSEGEKKLGIRMRLAHELMLGPGSALTCRKWEERKVDTESTTG